MADIDDDVLVSLDALTIAAIVQGRLDDSNEIASGSKGKQREGTLTDAQVALQLHNGDLNACATLLQDRMMAQSMCLAMIQDGAVIDEAQRQEDQAVRDHAMAVSMSGGTARRTIQPARNSSSALVKVPNTWEDPETLAKAAVIYNVGRPTQNASNTTASNGDEDEDITVAESSTWAALRAAFGEPPLCECAGCGDFTESLDLARVPCDHEYCRTCLEDIFVLSLKEKDSFPPRCCEEIQLSDVRKHLPSDLATDFEARYEELSTKIRTYCHEKACSAFIPPGDINEETGTCPQCKRTTCTVCKEAYHLGDCPKDESLQLLLQAADVAQWQRCYQCGRMVDLFIGCNHITCHCKAQFCYVCGEPWKTCECPQWDEDRLTIRAAEIATRHPNRRLYQPGQAPRRADDPATIAAIAAHLRDHHLCIHEHWQRLEGPHTCEQCGDDLRNFIFECRQCLITRCYRCVEDLL
ncbi:unnamed protein product [Zymoseptoria tritici ST99CH_1A5]|uniref:RBR-type E3 ubiquitin transferase n=1 Tax=Zymoseptoria tritici ST99CH_1A5 TaxID=1276529 RepID=A0A1Y6L3Y5_ZYMTR|nr:unnamed protein product [Zymoseptoria tritici ST99CH_3D1]SMY19192.1 unnamed protein product [Zymoseptoria tritici ST99CH_1A5]